MNHSPETLQTAYDALCAAGDEYTFPRVELLLEDVTFEHPRKGRLEVGIDEDALAQQGAIYTAEPGLRRALALRDIHTQDFAAASQLVGRYLEDDKLVWGFSGYATAGYAYSVEAAALSRVYEHLARKRKQPGLSIDGGVSAGTLGLNGVIARMHEVPTLGYIPLQGLSSTGTRDHLVVWGDTYKDREIMVGTTPDVLVCAAGAEGSQRECQIAVRLGSAVLLLALKDYGPNSLPSTYRTFDDLRAAEDSGSLVVCSSLEDVPEALETLMQTDPTATRDVRLHNLKTLLA